MKRELELKDIVGYLPYRLKCHCMGLIDDPYGRYPKPIEVEIVGLEVGTVSIHELGRTVDEQYYYSDVFPILHHISSLTGKKTGRELMNLLDCELFNIHELWIFSYKEITLEQISYSTYQVCMKNKLDIHGLIDEGLAVDYKTIKR